VSREHLRIKAVLSDVDATQVEDNQTIPSQRIQDAARELRKNYIPLLNVTARSYRLLREVAPFLDLQDNFCVIDGGATVARAMSGEVVWSNWLKPEKAREICLAVGKHSARIYYNSDSRHLSTKQIIADLEADILPPFSPAIFAVFDVNQSSHVTEALQDIEGIQSTPIMGYRGDAGLRCVQVTNEGISKRAGGAKMLELAGLTNEPVLAIGDGENDIALFELIENGVRVAMGNACDALKERADWIAPPVEEDGFAVAMQYFGLTK
jgi:hypothetical protein